MDTELEAALARVKQAEAALGAALPIMGGAKPTAEQKAAVQAATEELKAANAALAALPGAKPPPPSDAVIADLRKRLGQ
jgi:hypothetical protein